jgi:hypothetical protein
MKNVIVTFRNFANAPKKFGNVICFRIGCFTKCTYTMHTFLKLRPAAKQSRNIDSPGDSNAVCSDNPFCLPCLYSPSCLVWDSFQKKVLFLSLPTASRYAYITHICIRRLVAASGPACPRMQVLRAGTLGQLEFRDLIAAGLSCIVGLD